MLRMQQTHEQQTAFVHEPKITLEEARALFPGHPDLTTVWRWCVQGHGGQQLEYERAGRRIFTSAGAVSRFKATLLSADRLRFSRSPRRADPIIPTTRTDQRRQRDQDAARAKLDSAGF